MAGKKAKSVADQFKEAKARVEKLSSRRSEERRVELDCSYKQSTEGDVTGNRPGFLDLKGRAKYDAWAKRKGGAKDDAMKKYVALVDALDAELG